MPSTAPRLRRALRLTALGLMAPLAACSPAGVLNSFIPDEGFTVERDIAYGDHPRQRLDVYRPEGAQAPAPVVVFFYGGSWEAGAKGRYLFVGEALASAGAVVVIPDYRLWPEVKFPDFVSDGAAAVAWAQDNIARHGGDPGRIAVAGHSAGAHIAAMVVLDRRRLEDAGGDPAAVASLIGIAGPYDFLPIQDPTVKKIFAVPDMATTQPVTYARAGAPPALLLHGTDDRTVLPRNSVSLEKALEAAGSTAEVRLYEGIGHIEIIAALAAPLRWLADTRADILEFLGLGGEEPAG